MRDVRGSLRVMLVFERVPAWNGGASLLAPPVCTPRGEASAEGLNSLKGHARGESRSRVRAVPVRVVVTVLVRDIVVVTRVLSGS